MQEIDITQADDVAGGLVVLQNTSLVPGAPTVVGGPVGFTVPESGYVICWAPTVPTWY